MPTDYLKEAVIQRAKSEPFVHIVILGVLASVLWLIHIDKTQHIGTVILVGSGSVVMIIVSSIAMWAAARIDKALNVLVDHIQNLNTRVDSADMCLVSLKESADGIYKEIGNMSSGIGLLVKREKVRASRSNADLEDGLTETAVVAK